MLNDCDVVSLDEKQKHLSFCGNLAEKGQQKCQMQCFSSHTNEISLEERQSESNLQAQFIGWEHTQTEAEWNE